MPSIALHDWRSTRTGRLDRLQAAHALDGLATGMDRVTGDHLHRVFGTW